MLRKIFGQFGGTGIKLEHLEAKFLAKNPEYVQRTKPKQDAMVEAAKVVIEGLTANCLRDMLPIRSCRSRCMYALSSLSMQSRRILTWLDWVRLISIRWTVSWWAVWCINILQKGNLERVHKEYQTIRDPWIIEGGKIKEPGV